MLRFDEPLLNAKLFFHGPAGSGKTTDATRYVRFLLERGIAPERIVILVPQVTLGRPYQLALHDAQGGNVNIVTMASLARQAVETFWPLVAGPMGFAQPNQEPTFLNIETAQYFMARWVAPAYEEGRFSMNDVTVSEPRVISQLLDNLNRAAMLRFPLDSIAERLIAAWGDRDSMRPRVFEAAKNLAAEFRNHCLQNNVLDFSLIIEAFFNFLIPDPRFETYLRGQIDYLIAENIEEDNPATHDFIRWLMPSLKGALLVFDEDGGYRNFLGADSDTASELEDTCTESVNAETSVVMSPDLNALAYAFHRAIGPSFTPQEDTGHSARAAFSYKHHRFYPQMIDWVVDQVVELIRNGVPPREIVILAPYLNDSLRFSLSYKLRAKGSELGIEIPTLAHRPSRALRDEPTTRTLLTLAILAHPEWGLRPPAEDVSDALIQAIDGIDPVRARLLTEIAYRRKAEVINLSSFAKINTEMQKRITFLVGERFEMLREWLESYKAQVEHEGAVPLDHFLRRLFGELLTQPGFGFHTDLEAGRIAAQLIQSAGQFRRALYPGEDQDWAASSREYLDLINKRLLPALFAQSWQDEEADAVFMAPASTFLLRNRFVDYQFWLDVGSNGWGERLEQPLTHPYVLRRGYDPTAQWTDELETEAQQTALYRISVGLARRCRKGIFLGIADLGESGFEQRGMLLRVLQQVLRASGEAEQNS